MDNTASFMGEDDSIPDLIPISLPEEVSVKLSVRKPVPVTIITGALGSGKSTLLSHLLSDPNHGQRIAVIMNEFGGSGGMDKSLLVSRSEVSNGTGRVEEWLELANGCFCCSMKDKGVKAVENMLLANPSIDYVLLETTGLADPGPIAHLFWLDGALEALVSLDGVVTVVDACHIEKQLHPTSPIAQECARQIAMADRIIVNKMDLVADGHFNSAIITDLNPLADLYPTTRSAVSVDFLLNLNCFNDGSFVVKESLFRSQSTPIHRKAVSNGVSTVTIHLESGTIDRSRLEAWIRQVLWEHQLPGYDNGSTTMEVYRMKGAFAFTDKPSAKFILQSVYEMYEIISTGDWESEEEDVPKARNNRLVIIGTGLDQAILSESFIQHVTKNCNT